MTDSPTPYTPDPEQKISKNSVMLSQLRKRGTIYVSALALALTAALGTASSNSGLTAPLPRAKA